MPWCYLIERKKNIWSIDFIIFFSLSLNTRFDNSKWYVSFTHLSLSELIFMYYAALDYIYGNVIEIKSREVKSGKRNYEINASLKVVGISLSFLSAVVFCRKVDMGVSGVSCRCYAHYVIERERKIKSTQKTCFFQKVSLRCG